MLEVAAAIMGGRGLEYDIPSRTEANQVFVQELDRYVLKDSSRPVPTPYCCLARHICC